MKRTHGSSTASSRLAGRDGSARIDGRAPAGYDPVAGNMYPLRPMNGAHVGSVLRKPRRRSPPRSEDAPMGVRDFFDRVIARFAGRAGGRRSTQHLHPVATGAAAEGRM